MATRVLTPITVKRLEGLSAIPVVHVPEAASQSFVEGAVLVNSSGRCAIAAADTTSAIIGVACHAASGTTDTDIMIVKALPGVIFEANLEDESNEDHALVVTNRFGQYAIQVSSGIFYLDENDSGNDATIVTGFTDAIGDVRARVEFQFLFTKTVWGAS